MNDINLTPKLQQKMSSRPRVRGRYNASEMYFIINGSTTPEQWLNPSEKKVKEMLTMWDGIGTHNQIQDLLGKDHCEMKKEWVYKGIILVGKVDFMPPNSPDDLWEIKSSERKMTTAKPWHEYQAKLYCTMFNKKRGLIYQPVKNSEGVYLKHLGTVEKSDGWFEIEMIKLFEFHEKVERLWNSKIN